MAKFIPPLFARLYLGIILALGGSVFITLSFSYEALEQSNLLDFSADTDYIFNEISVALENNHVDPEQYIQSLPKTLLTFDIKWHQTWDGAPECNICVG